MEPNRNTLILIVAIALVVGLALGYFAGNASGSASTEQKFTPLLELAFPKPPTDIRSLSGTVKSMYGASISLEVRDPEDYLPHLDGSPHRTVARVAQVSAATTYTLIDYSKLNAQGNPAYISRTLSDLKAGDVVIVRSNENIRDAETFDATAVELVKY